MRRKKNFKKGIQFCLMVCGASGTGKFSYKEKRNEHTKMSFPLIMLDC